MDTFTHHHQPYGTIIFAVESVAPVQAPSERCIGNDWIFNRAAKGWVELTGTVVRGSETSRLFHAAHTRDMTGEPYVLQVPPEAHKRGEYTSVAM